MAQRIPCPHADLIQWIIAGDAVNDGQAPPTPLAGQEPSTPEMANEQPQQGAEQPDQESGGSLEGPFKQIQSTSLS
ncbi:hypothetical protein I6F07_26840 [Ensifer sp. IC4062]|nr:hypothetical protein [Ensifer sp. IC4062]MCA1443764.1 hypothetical protein [Ensifer sp. IC4062]